MNERLISHSETSALLTCQYRHDFMYGEQLAGTSLKPKHTPPILSDGRAWGAGGAAYNAGESLDYAIDTISDTLTADADRLKHFGTFDQNEFDTSLSLLHGLLEHYADENEPLGIDRLEHELIVPIPSRSGKQDSNRYRLQVFFDGIHVDEHGRTWLVEFKLRGQLSQLLMVHLSRQIRWYAWAYRKEYGVMPAGIIVDERLKKLPSEVKLNKNGSVSKVQSCTVDAYQAAGGDDPEVLQKLTDKKWGIRESVPFTDAEIDEAGIQLVSAGQQIRSFDAGETYPVRNPSPLYCNGCQFKDICQTPDNTELVDALFERTTPKKDRSNIREEVPA